MKKANKDSNFENSLFKTLKYYNYSFPKSDKEIEEYLNTDGLSKLEMPERLSDPDAIYDQITEKNNLNISALAAHEGKTGIDISDDLLKKLDDIEKQENEIINDRKRRKKD